jgi:carboxymethylenebutenolidase
MAFRSLQAQTVAFPAYDGDRGEAYFARPAGDGPFPGIVVIHHFPGWDEWTCEVVRKLAHHGFMTIAPSLYFRLGDGSDPAIVAQARAEGGMPDDQVVADVAGAAAYLRAQPHSNGRVGVIGFCSGGRHAFLTACRVPAFDAAVDCWGGNVVVDDAARLTERQPVAAIDFAEHLHCPLLGIFGNEDTNPSPAQVNTLEAALKRSGKVYDFHRYDGAGHAFNAWYRPNYRQEQAQDAWVKTLAFFNTHLGTA